MDTVLGNKDVWFVTNWQAVEWMRNPVTNGEISSFDFWGCWKQSRNREMFCANPNTCNVYSGVFRENRTLNTCSKCPKVYPWVRNEFGVM